MLLRERFWLWGHPEGDYNNKYGNEGISRMTPMEGCLYLGVPNTFMTAEGPKEVNKRQYNKSFKTLRNVGWECFRSGIEPEQIEVFLADAAEFPNNTCTVFDDFIRLNAEALDETSKVSPEKLWRIREQLKNNKVRSFDMWMVLYTREFGVNQEIDKEFMPFLEPFDGVIMWTWEEKDVPLIPEKFEIFKRMTPNNRRMFGCYLYNFGEEKQATGEAVKWQLDWYREKIYAGEAEGVVLHTNTMADLDYEAYDVACEWMEMHGDEIVPDIE